jgi:hypothetical protein
MVLGTKLQRIWIKVVMIGGGDRRENHDEACLVLDSAEGTTTQGGRNIVEVGASSSA